MVILIQPDQFDALYELTPFVFDSGNKTETNFKYLIDVTVDGKTYSFEIPPYADNGYGVFNVKDLVKASQVGNEPQEQELFNISFPSFDLTSGERYTDSNGNKVENPSLVSVSNRRLSNAVEEHNTSYSYQTTDFLTDNPTKVYYVKGQPALLPFRKDANKQKLEITGQKTKDISNLNVDSLHVLDGNRFTTLDNFTVKFIDGDGFPEFEKDFEVVDCNHDLVTPYTLVWLNKYGAYDSFPFTQRDTVKREISSDTYRKRSFSINAASPIYNEEKRGYRKFGIRSERVQTLRSNWITEEQLRWLAGLFDSPETYIHDGDGYKGVMIEADEVDEKIGNKLFNLTVQIRYSVNSITQSI